MITLRLEKVTCWNALNRMLNIRGLVLVEDPVTQVARIAFSGQALPNVDTSLLGMDPNSLNLNTNDIIPVIQFFDLPLDTVLEALIRQCGLQIELDPRLKDNSSPQHEPPMLSLRWTNLTVRQALVALCENYDLIITKNDMTGIIQIKPGKIKKYPPQQSQ